MPTTTRSKVVLSLTPYWPLNEKPGRGSFVVNLHDGLRKAGQLSRVFVLNRYRPLAQKKDIRIRADQADRELVQVFNLNSIGRISIFDLLWVRVLIAKIEDHIGTTGKPDVIVVHTLNPLLCSAASTIARRHGCKTIVISHGSDYRRILQRNYARCYYGTIFRRLDALAAPSRTMLEQLPLWINNRMVIPNIVADVFFLQLNLKRERDIDLLFIGRLSFEKGFDIFLEVVARLRSMNKGLRVAVVGEPIDYNPEETGFELELSMSRMPQPDVAALMGRSKALLLPSRHEAFGMVAAEAQAAGCAVVGTRCGGLEDVIFDQSAIFNLDDVDGMIAKLTSLLNSDRGRQSRAEFVRNSFTITSVLSQLDEL